MKKIIFTLTALFISFYLLAQEEKRLALVIGNSNYSNAELKNPVNDAKLIASTLDSLNFEVILKTNVESQGQFKNAILEFGKKRPDYDAAIVYYAGHGMQLDGENYLLPTKESFDSKDEVFMSGVSVQKIMHFLRDSNKVNILILDACRDNPYENSFNKSRSFQSSAASRGLAKILAPTGSLIAFSTDSGNVAKDGIGDNSIYSLSLSKNMLLVDTSVDQVFRNVRAEVLKLSGGNQRPVEETQLTGDIFYLNKSDYTDELERIEEIVNNEEENKYQNSILTIEKILNRYPNNLTAQNLKGLLLFGLKSYDNAINYFNSLIELNGNDADYFIKLGLCYLEMDLEDKAQENYNKAIELEPEEGDHYCSRAEFFEKEEEYTKALTDYNKAIELDPDDMDFLYKRALLYQNNLDDHEKALGDYLRIVELDKDQEFAKENYLYNNIGLIYEDEIKDYQKALEYYNKEIGIRPEKGEGFSNRAVLYYNDLNDKEKALEDFDKAIELEPTNDEHYYYRGNFFQETEEYEKALLDFNKAIKLDPDDMGNLNLRAINYQNYLYDYEKALGDYLKIVELDKDQEFAKENYLYNNIGLIYRFNIKDYQKALEYYTKEIEVHPKSAVGFRNRADLYYNDLNDKEKALEGYNKAIELEPNDGYNYSNRAEFFEKEEEYTKALLDYNKAIEIDPDDMDYLYKRAVLFYNNLDDYEKALRDYLRIVELDKDQEFAKENYLYNGIGLIYKYRIKDYQKALEYYTKEIEISPEYGEGYVNRATIYYTYLNDKESALKDCNKAIELEPNDEGHYYFRAIYFEETEEYKKALLDYNKAIEIEPNDMDNLNRRAMLFYNNLDDYEKALMDYLKIVELDKDQEFAKENYLYNNIGLIYRYHIKDYQKALEYYTKEIEVHPKSAVGFRNRADLYYEKLNDKEKALEDFDKAIELEPENENYYYYRAEFFEEEEEYEKALLDYNKAIEIDPDDMDNLEKKAEVMVKLKQYQNAIDMYKAVIDNYAALVSEKKISYDKGTLEIIYHSEHISDIYFEFLNDYKKSIFYVEKAIKAYSYLKEKNKKGEGYAIGLRGKIYLNIGELDKAKKDFLKAIELDPEDRNSYFNLVNYYLTVKEYEKAIETIDKTIEMDYNDPDGFYKESLIYYDQKDYLNSLICISNAILKAQEEDRLANGDYYISDLNNIDRITLDDLYAFRGNLFSILGNKKSACEDYQKVKDLGGDKIDSKIEMFISTNCK